MFLLDDILLAPIHGILWVGQKVHQAAQQGLAEEEETITALLRESYLMLEAGKITEAEFALREQELLDRLDKLAERPPLGEDEDEDLPAPSAEKAGKRKTSARRRPGLSRKEPGLASGGL